MNTRLLMISAALAIGTAHSTFAGTDGAPVSGEGIYAQACSSCHEPGLMDAPKVGDTADWRARLQKAGSVDALVTVAIHGRGNMPPRGGESDLSDADVKAAVQFMLSKSGAGP
jgi:cytochrome c5